MKATANPNLGDRRSNLGQVLADPVERQSLPNGGFTPISRDIRGNLRQFSRGKKAQQHSSLMILPTKEDGKYPNKLH